MTTEEAILFSVISNNYHGDSGGEYGSGAWATCCFSG